MVKLFIQKTGIDLIYHTIGAKPLALVILVHFNPAFSALLCLLHLRLIMSYLLHHLDNYRPFLAEGVEGGGAVGAAALVRRDDLIIATVLR